MSKVTRIAILGGGFAGTTVALQLEKLLRKHEDIEITLLDTENFFTFTPLLPEVPSGSIQPKHIVFPLRALLRRTLVRQAEVQAIDLDRKEIVARHCGKCGRYTLPFDHLVLALGGVSNFFNTPGAAEHALTMKSLSDATRLHAHVIDKLEHADLQTDPEIRRELLTFVVAGGGFAGVETIAELNDFVRGAERFYPHIQADEIRLILVQSGPRILPEVSETLSSYALQKLTGHGVEVLLQTKVARCSDHAIFLSNADEIRCHTFVWTAGVSPSPIVERLDLPRTPQGKIDVESTLSVAGRTGIWAVGDSAAIPDVVTGKLCPPTAQYALRQGKTLAQNIAAAIDGRKPVEFRHKSLGLLAGLGRRCAVAEVFGMRFSGFVAWWMWRTIYLLKLPGLERKLRVALDWTLDLFFARDIVYLRPLHAVRGGEHVPALEAAGDDACEIDRSDAESLQSVLA